MGGQEEEEESLILVADVVVSLTQPMGGQQAELDSDWLVGSSPSVSCCSSSVISRVSMAMRASMSPSRSSNFSFFSLMIGQLSGHMALTERGFNHQSAADHCTVSPRSDRKTCYVSEVTTL